MKPSEAAKILLSRSSVRINDPNKKLIAACQQLAAAGLADHLPAMESPIKFEERYRANARTQEALI